MKVSRLVAMACLSLLLAGPIWAQGKEQTEKQKETELCPHRKGWTPTADEMQRILADHAQWVRIWEDESEKKGLPPPYLGSAEGITPQGRANLCNVNWLFKIENAHLAGVNLNNANLSTAELNNFDLRYAELNNANLAFAQLNNANLMGAKLNNANLDFAKLNNADLSAAKLNNANLMGAKLNDANLDFPSLTGAKLAFADLTRALYDPESAPDPDVAGIEGLDTVRIPPGPRNRHRAASGFTAKGRPPRPRARGDV